VKILISLALGSLIGMEIERRMKETFAGFRTFMLVCLFGLISSLILVLSFLFIGSFAAANFYRSLTNKRGITTEIAFILTFLIGVILYYEKYPNIISLTLAFFAYLNSSFERELT